MNHFGEKAKPHRTKKRIHRLPWISNQPVNASAIESRFQENSEFQVPSKLNLASSQCLAEILHHGRMAEAGALYVRGADVAPDGVIPDIQELTLDSESYSFSNGDGLCDCQILEEAARSGQPRVVSIDPRRRARADVGAVGEAVGLTGQELRPDDV